MVPSRSPSSTLPPSGLFCGSLTGGTPRMLRCPPADRNYPRRATGPSGSVRGGSVRDGQCEHLRTLSLGQPAPDSVRLVHLQGVCTTRCQGRTFETHGLCLRLPPGTGGSPFALRVEEERTGHSSARCVQLPIPQVRVRAWQAPGISHVDPLCRRRGGRVDCSGARSSIKNSDCHQSRSAHCGRDGVVPDHRLVGPSIPGIVVRRASRLFVRKSAGDPRVFATSTDSSLLGRIRADPGVVDVQTVELPRALDKTLIIELVDLDQGVTAGRDESGPAVGAPGGWAAGRTATRRRSGPRSRLFVRMPLLSAVIGSTIARFVPIPPFGGPYPRLAGAQGFSTPAGVAVQLLFTPSAGGVT